MRLMDSKAALSPPRLLARLHAPWHSTFRDLSGFSDRQKVLLSVFDVKALLLHMLSSRFCLFFINSEYVELSQRLSDAQWYIAKSAMDFRDHEEAGGMPDVASCVGRINID
jgi:hypothetical protein